ncbi:hypothetical protein BDV93DRAFT_513750 [Ceratobasidium sp. AG-I]|nr:hypothetical protein BDV93DRAFT_513750 [Ceratobasidium sp. AG-I]
MWYQDEVHQIMVPRALPPPLHQPKSPSAAPSYMPAHPTLHPGFLLTSAKTHQTPERSGALWSGGAPGDKTDPAQGEQHLSPEPNPGTLLDWAEIPSSSPKPKFLPHNSPASAPIAHLGMRPALKLILRSQGSQGWILVYDLFEVNLKLVSQEQSGDINARLRSAPEHPRAHYHVLRQLLGHLEQKWCSGV